MTVLETVKMGMTPPLKSTVYDDTLAQLIEASLLEMYLAGVQDFRSEMAARSELAAENSLLAQACIFYCKANGFDDDGPRYQAAFDRLKVCLAVSAKFGGEKGAAK